MKIRMGFVSNSSSSSFCIYGCKIPMEEVEAVEKKLKEKKLYSTSGPDDDYSDDYYVGREWSEIGGEETGNQFKQSVESAIKELFGSDHECSTYEEGWYNG